MTQPHRFRPRYRGLAWSAIGIGGALLAAGIGFATLPLAAGAIGVVVGAAYLGSPTWRLEVVTDDEAIEVRGPRGPKFRLAWNEIVRVVAAPTSHTCFVDGGAPERSLLVPGQGAPAPYDISSRAELVATILARVSPERITIVESLEAAPEPRERA